MPTRSSRTRRPRADERPARPDCSPSSPQLSRSSRWSSVRVAPSSHPPPRPNPRSRRSAAPRRPSPAAGGGRSSAANLEASAVVGPDRHADPCHALRCHRSSPPSDARPDEVHRSSLTDTHPSFGPGIRASRCRPARVTHGGEPCASSSRHRAGAPMTGIHVVLAAFAGVAVGLAISATRLWFTHRVHDKTSTERRARCSRPPER